MPRMSRQSPRVLADRQRERWNSQRQQPEDQGENFYSPAAVTAGKLFDSATDSIGFLHCDSCHRKLLWTTPSNSECSTCKSAKKNLFLPSNNMDPGPIPGVLSGLTNIEQLMIARIHPVISYFRIRGGQFGYTGNVINFRQDITRLHESLPPGLDTLQEIIIGVQEGFHRTAELRVRPERIRQALRWLKVNNIHYQDIIIDNVELQRLSRDPDLSSLLENQPVSDTMSAGPDEETGLEETFFANIPNIDQEEVITRMRADTHTAEWPQQNSNAVNEFTTDGYIAQAFPTLFPYGRADFRAERNEKLSATDYFHFLMRYSDGRFSKHTRFRFFAMNTILRWQALGYAKVYIQRNRFGDSSVEAVMARITADPSLKSAIMVYAGNLRSTTPYWRQRCGELLDMVNQLGVPTVFFTLSAADYHWNKLFRLLAPDRDPTTITGAERRRLMHSDPMTTSEFFKKRIELFRKHILTPVFKVKDYWMRYEWQFRGSPHVHGILWLEGGDILKNLESRDSIQEEAAISYSDRLTKAWNPDSSVRLLGAQHPCQKTFTEVENYRQDLSLLLNTVQRHTICGRHCQRKKRNSNEVVCRFGFPITEQAQSHFSLENGTIVFLPKRNDNLMSRYNPLVSQTWRANIDFSVITNVETILNYIAKYVSKGEPSSTNFNELVVALSNQMGDEASGPTLIRKILQASLSGRDYSAQEVCHVLMGWSLFEASRSFVSLNVNENQWTRLDEGDPRAIVGMMAKYRNRPLNDTNNGLSLYYFFRNYRVQGNLVQLREKAAIVRVYPRIKPTSDPAQTESYHRQQVVLYIPWRFDPRTILELGDGRRSFESWTEAFEYHSPEQNPEIDFPEQQDEFEEEPAREENERDLEMALARMRLNVPIERPIGDRLIDYEQDWSRERDHDYSKESLDSFLRSYKQEPLVNPPQSTSTTLVESPEQMRIMMLCNQQIQEILDSGSGLPKRVLVQGKAGTGKSYIIGKIVEAIEQKFSQGSVHVLAPTGVAATNINGKTYHSFLRIPCKASFSPLNGQAQRNFQLKMERVKFLIFDEVSMIGLGAMKKIESRCREAFPTKDEVFGGIRIYFFGDLMQLPPVLDIPVFRQNITKPVYAEGKIVFQSIQVFFQMTTCFRQGSPDQATFRAILDSIAQGIISESHYNILMSRLEHKLPRGSQRVFSEALHLFSTNQEVAFFNRQRLAATGFPVAKFDAEHNNSLAQQGSVDSASGLAPSLELSVGSRVMLRKNLWVEGGLVNGSLGVITDIIYEENRSPPSLPFVIMVKFDKYRGTSYADGSFPVMTTTSFWNQNNVDCSRKQFPINLAYAMTIHKSQGLTLDKVVIDIGEKEATSGLTYVAMSRVRRLLDLALPRAFPRTRIDNIQNTTSSKERKQFMQSIRFRS